MKLALLIGIPLLPFTLTSPVVKPGIPTVEGTIHEFVDTAASNTVKGRYLSTPSDAEDPVWDTDHKADEKVNQINKIGDGIVSDLLS